MNYKINLIFYKILKFLCFVYVVIGAILWIKCLLYTNYYKLVIPKGIIGVDGPMSYIWDTHDKSWNIFDAYTFPMQIISLPIYIGLALLVNEGIITLFQFDLITLYLVFVPTLLFSCITWIIAVIRKAFYFYLKH